MAFAKRTQAVPDGQWLQGVASRFSFAGWCWVKVGADHAAAPWSAASGMKATVRQVLDNRLGCQLAV